MPHTHHVVATVPRDDWDECYFALLSLKMHLQSLPGWQEMAVNAEELAGPVQVRVDTTWKELDQLEIWMEHGITPDALIRSISPNSGHISSEVATRL